jgi:hypothetical protein
MPSIDVDKLLKAMLGAARASLGKSWPDVRDYATTEFKKIGESIRFIGEQVAAGKMDEEEAELQLSIQQHASRSALLAAEGLGLLAAEEAINAALGAIKDVVNNALKFTLL